MNQADIGMIGLAVMGENLALNMADKGLTVAVYDKNAQNITRFISTHAQNSRFIAVTALKSLAECLKPPRKVMLMIRAGQPVDDVIESLLPHLDPGDVIIDGGNAHFADTIRRTRYVADHGLYYIGAGVSGGELGARFGPSIMPGGTPEGWPLVKPILQSIAARAKDGSPCCDWVGPDGAGHFVKMVHNGIEYGDMQMICEAYHLMSACLGMAANDIADAFDRWNHGRLKGYLTAITRDILRHLDEDGEPLVDKILDAAQQKGTGKWACVAALDERVAFTVGGEAVFARCLSAARDERIKASKVLGGPAPCYKGDQAAFLELLENALYLAKLISYTQGFELMRSASRTYGWELDLGGIALLWRGGCIIRSAFLEGIDQAYRRYSALDNLLLDSEFASVANGCQESLRGVVMAAAQYGIPVPAFAAALSYYDAFRCGALPANLLQAQRDYFGAHMYERVDSPRGTYFHTDWTGQSGAAFSTTYTV